MSTRLPIETTDIYEAGRRLYCHQCGSEIEIINPSPLRTPDQVFRCCGADMSPTPGRTINLGVE